MELKDLAGEHVLTGVDEQSGTIKSKYGDGEYEGNSIRFRLDGVVYIAREDEDDGYRSSMRDIEVSEFPMESVFDRNPVVGVYRNRRDGCECDILELVDTKTGRIVLEVGTDNSDDYYPSFVASFHPEAMSINAAVQP